MELYSKLFLLSPNSLRKLYIDMITLRLMVSAVGACSDDQVTELQTIIMEQDAVMRSKYCRLHCSVL